MGKQEKGTEVVTTEKTLNVQTLKKEGTSAW